MVNFRALSLAATFYRSAKNLPLSGNIKNQLLRASASICLNLAEGRGRHTLKDQVRHFHIAMGSVREAQAVLMIEDLRANEAWSQLDRCAAAVYRLIERAH